MSHRVELLAPAGSPEGFFGALHAGADAVYLAGSRFGARAYADNFTTEELSECIRYAHILDRKVYLTVNTLIKETEFEELYDFLSPLYDAGLDGVIVQDIGVFLYIRRHFPKLKLHASTQMTLTGGYGASMLGKMGASRVVPARELNLAEIKALKEASGLEVETFIHGAMCYCYSGQCLFSSILGGRSGNRGRCAQPCRLPYRVERDGRKTGECYPLSLKDLCTIEHLPELIEAGIDSFKIEGRMKKPEYAAGVTAIYRKYIDLYYETIRNSFTCSDRNAFMTSEQISKKTWGIEKPDRKLLSSLYIRSERQDGYYFRQNGRDMVSLHNPSYSGSDETALTEIRERYISKRPRKSVTITADFTVGKPAVVSLRAEGMSGVTVTVTGETVSAALKQPVTEENLRKQLGKLGDTLFEAADIRITVDPNAFYSLKAVNELRRQAVSLLEDELIRQNGFAVERTDRLSPERSNPNSPIHPNPNSPVQALDPSPARGALTDAAGTTGLHISLRDTAQLKAVTSLFDAADPIAETCYRPSRLYVDADLFCPDAQPAIWSNSDAVPAGNVFGTGLNIPRSDSDRDIAIQQCKKLADAGCQIILALPPILRKKDIPYLEKLWEFYGENSTVFAGFLIRSMEGIGFLQEKGCDALYADAGFYIWNRETMNAVTDPGGYFSLKGFCLPYELNSGEQHRLLKGEHIPCEKIVYGRIPLMVTANCVANTIDGCQNDRYEYHLIDRYNKRFPVLRCCAHCMNIIYNSLPLSLHRELHKWEKDVDFRLDFTIENEEETSEILRYFLGGAKGDPPYPEYTTGHEKRGAE